MRVVVDDVGIIQLHNVVIMVFNSSFLLKFKAYQPCYRHVYILIDANVKYLCDRTISVMFTHLCDTYVINPVFKTLPVHTESQAPGLWWFLKYF